MARKAKDFDCMLDRRFREILKATRLDKGLSQSEVARRLGVKHATYHEIENGNCSPNLATIEKIASVLELDPLELLEEKTAGAA